MHHPIDRIVHTTAFVTPVVEHWPEREIAQWVHPMKDRSGDPSHHERTLLPRSYISLLCVQLITTTGFAYLPPDVVAGRVLQGRLAQVEDVGRVAVTSVQRQVVVPQVAARLVHLQPAGQHAQRVVQAQLGRAAAVSTASIKTNH